MARKIENTKRYRNIEIYFALKISRQRDQDREIDKKEGI